MLICGLQASHRIYLSDSIQKTSETIRFPRFWYSFEIK
nr:MAG TPA: hypothetical protein [Caudoviricetes sp.]